MMSVHYLHPVKRVVNEEQTQAGGLIAPRFTSDGRSFVRLILRGGLLQLVTAGFTGSGC
jgi:hypothetical protein